MDLSIIIVNYNVKFYLEHCLISVLNAVKNIEAEIIVIDNYSSDDSANYIKDKFPQVHLIENKENLGFSKANNQALKIAKGKYCLLLNPDTIISDDTLKKCFDFMEEHLDAGALGVKMVSGEGKFLPESKRGFPTPKSAFFKFSGLAKLFNSSAFFNHYHLGHLNNNLTHEVDVLAGAFMFLRKSVLDQIGFLDEKFFMYGEDIDLSYRITQAGYKNYYYPEIKIIHFKGESTKKSSINYVLMFYKAMLVFARKHYSKNKYKSLIIVISLSIYIKGILAFFENLGRIPLNKLSSKSKEKNRRKQRILIIANNEEHLFLTTKLRNHYKNIELLEFISPSQTIRRYAGFIGCFPQIKDITKIYRANYLVLNTNQTPICSIITKLTALNSRNLIIKYTTSDSKALIGSSHIIE